MAQYGRGSFGRFSQNEGTSSASTVSTGSQEEISKNIQTIQHNVTQLQNIVERIGTKLDSRDLRIRIKEMLQHTSDCLKVTTQALKDLPDTPPTDDIAITSWKLKKNLLSENIRDVFKSFQNTQNNTKRRLRESLRKSIPLSLHDEGTSEISRDQDNNQHQMALQETKIDLQTIQEREEEINELEQDITDLADIFKTMNVMVDEQGEQLDAVEDNVNKTVVHVEKAKEDLTDAAEAQTSARHKKCSLLLVVGSVVAVVVLFIVLGATGTI